LAYRSWISETLIRFSWMVRIFQGQGANRLPLSFEDLWFVEGHTISSLHAFLCPYLITFTDDLEY